MGPLANKTVQELKLGLRHVHTVTNGTQALQAFKILIRESVSGVAIVDDDNKVIGNISASDLKLIGYDMELYSKLFGTVADFVKQKELFSNLSAIPITTAPSSTFKEILELFEKHKVHRIYVVDDTKPLPLVGVITQGDVLKCFASQDLVEWQDYQFSQT